MTLNNLFSEYNGLIASNGLKDFEIDEITKDDLLIVVDMQNDFLPKEDAPEGGRFGVADGKAASDAIVPLAHLFATKGAKLIFTKDYHPVDHCSFSSEGGPFPPHCIQGHPGSHFFPPIAKAINNAILINNIPSIVFKGFCEDIDSFGSLPYKLKYAESRLSHKSEPINCSLIWTGSFELKSSNFSEDVDAPPDVLSVLRKKPLQDVIGSDKSRRIFICGLALDYCVLDTAINICEHGYKNVFIIRDATRAAHIPGVGQFGSGFLTDPKSIIDYSSTHGFKFVTSTKIH